MAVLLLMRAGVVHDVPNERSSHAHNTPTLGGISFALPILLATFWMQPLLVSTSLILIMVVGAIDDIHGLSYRTRLAVQALAATALIYKLGYIHSTALWALPLPLPFYLAFGITLFVIMGIINGTNFIDGLNGLLSGCMMMAMITWWIATPAWSSIWMVSLASLTGYWIMNRKGGIFMGDVGSTFLGLWIAVMALSMQSVHPEYAMGGLCTQGLVIVLAPLMFVWGDVTFTLLHRWKRGEVLSQAHRDHFIHRLVDGGYSHVAITSLYMLGTLYMGLMTLAYVKGHIHLMAFIASYLVPQTWIARKAFSLSKN